eukprot:358390-Chlamydomonas_euryale.AAC.3
MHVRRLWHSTAFVAASVKGARALLLVVPAAVECACAGSVCGSLRDPCGDRHEACGSHHAACAFPHAACPTLRLTDMFQPTALPHSSI